MEEQTLYRKVHIHGEEDLPKEEGHYVVHDKQEDKVFQLGFFLEPKYDLPAIWMSIVDWYLLPVKQEPGKSAEEIINKVYDKIREDLRHATMLYFDEDDCNKYPLIDYLSSGSDISTGIDEINNLIEQIEIEPLLEAYASQSLPSDEEIHEAAYNACMKPSMPNGEPEPEHTFYDAFVQCADWLKSCLTDK